MFRSLLIVLVIFGTTLCTEYKYPKCCDSDSVVEKSDSVFYNCTEDLSQRTQILTNRTNFKQSGEEGSCVDVENGSVSLFKNNDTNLMKVKDLNVDFYPKCCPLDYFYNSTSHGCVKSTNKLETFFGESFVRVGLPLCKIIEDLPVNTNNRIERLNGSLYFTNVYQQGSYCVDKNEHNLFVVRICHSDYEVCDRIRCIRKCCLDGQSFVNGSFCRNTFVHGVDVSSYTDYVENVNEKFAVVHDGYNKPIYPLFQNRFKFHLDNRGIFTMVELEESLGKINITRHYDVYEKAYCVEHAIKGTLNTYLFFRSFSDTTQIKYISAGIAMAISCVFLVITILYYCFSDEKRTLFGKILISYCTTSLTLFIFLSCFAFYRTRPQVGCVGLAFMVLYLTISTFIWMNVMCIDIYCTFGSSKSFSSRQHRSQELKRFLLYSLHGWGTPFILTMIPLIFYGSDVFPFAFKVLVDKEKCLIFKGDGNYALFIFSTFPVTIMQICDLVLFIQTVRYCLKVKREINRMNDTHAMKGERKQKLNKYRDRLGLLMKLFFIMGISFLFEVVSTFCDFKKHGNTMAIIELVWDTFNSLQGLFIFLIFILKKRIFRKFQKQVGLQKLRKISLVSSAITQTTALEK